MISKDVAQFLYGVLLNQNIPINNPEFRKVADLSVRALNELEAIINIPEVDVEKNGKATLSEVGAK